MFRDDVSMIQHNPGLPPVAGVILAAGASSRMGQAKLLLPWKGEPLIRHAARTALHAGLDPVVVVTGCGADEIQAALNGLNVQLQFNPAWQEGQSTSVRAGIQALPGSTSAAIFLLGDQPYVTPQLIQALVIAYAQSHPLILAPFVGDKRGNPVLFDHTLFNTLCQLQGDAGARTIFNQYPPQKLPWDDERLLWDVDTPQDYKRLQAS